MDGNLLAVIFIQEILVVVEWGSPQQLEQEGASDAWRKEQQLVCGMQYRMRHTQIVHATTLHPRA